MVDVSSTPSPQVRALARESQGTSSDSIYRRVDELLEGRHPGGGVLADVGCGTGQLGEILGRRFDRVVGVDAEDYGVPAGTEFHAVDLNAPHWPLPDAFADVAAAVETIEHLDNPRAFVRELARLAKPGGWVVVTTPNQLSLLSKATLVLKNQFNSFQERPGLYPAHRTALLEIDLIRIARETGLTDVVTDFTRVGRLPGTGRHWPGWLARRLPRAFSDNVLMFARKR